MNNNNQRYLGLVIVVFKILEVIRIRVLALDQATVSGYVFFNNYDIIDKGLISLKDVDFPLSFFRQTLVELINKHKPDVLPLEDLRSMRNAFTVRRLQQITGVAREVCETYGIPCYECLTVTVRSKLCTVKTGEKGRATKFDLARRVCSMYDWEYPTNKNGTEIKNAQHKFFNITDAAGIGLYYLKYVGGVEDV